MPRRRNFEAEARRAGFVVVLVVGQGWILADTASDAQFGPYATKKQMKAETRPIVEDILQDQGGFWRPKNTE